MSVRFFAALFFSALLAASAVYAADNVGIVTGQKTGTYFAFGKDIAQVGAKAGIEVSVKASEGSIDNIKRINSSENAALGIVQSDVLGFLSRSKTKESMRMVSNLRMIFPFYNEEVHVLARNGIRSFADLQGKKVAVGEDGSGNMLTAVNLLSMMNVTPAESRKISSAQGVVAVLKGELDAVVFVGGKPVRLFKNLEDLTLPENRKYASMLDQVHFLAMDDPKMLGEYKPAQLTRADYSFVQDPVPTIAVQALLVSFDFSQGKGKGKPHCQTLSRLAQALRSNLSYLKEKGHPKWKEVDLDADMGMWKKDSCVWPTAPKAEGNELIKLLEKGK